MSPVNTGMSTGDWTSDEFVNSSNMTSSPVYDVMTIAWLRAILVTLYSVIFVLGIAGNSLVVFVVLRNKSMQNPTNVFICNLALSDVMMCLLAVPFTIITGLSNSWIFGKALCHIVPMSLGVSVHVSSLTSIAIAVDRYCAIVHPFRPRITVHGCCAVIVAVWIASVVLSLPLAIYMQHAWEAGGGIAVCDECWPSYFTRQVYTVTSLVFQYIIPCGIISVCYGLISAALDRRAQARKGMSADVSKQGRKFVREWSSDAAGRGGVSSEREQAEIRRKRRTNRMLIAMVAIFVGCWLPINVINLTADYVPELHQWEFFMLLFFIAHVIAMSSTVYNPFLYAWMNDSFRSEFKKVVPCLFFVGNACCSCFVRKSATKTSLLPALAIAPKVCAEHQSSRAPEPQSSKTAEQQNV